VSDRTPTGPRTRLSDLDRRFWWLWFAVLVTWTGRFVVPFMSLFLTGEAGLSGSAAGLVVAGYGGGVVLSAFAGGLCADLLGRKRTLVASLVLSAATLTVVPAFDDPVVIAALLCVFGLVNGAAQPAIATLIVDIAPRQHLRAAFAYKYWAVNLGYAAGPLFAGLLADHAFRYLFFGQAGVLLVAAGIVVARVPETLPTTGPTASGKNDEQAAVGISDVLRDRVFVAFVLAMFGYSVVYVQSTVALPLAMVDDGFSTQDYGYLLTLNGVLLCLLQLPSARVLGRWRREAVLVGALCVTAVGVGLQAVATSWPVYALAVTVWTLGEMGGHPSAQSIASDLSSPRARGRYQGVYALAFSAATMVAPVVGGTVLDRFGAPALWVSCAALCLSIACCLALTARVRERRIHELVRADGARRERPHPDAVKP
jgi:MFS family permease